MSSAAPLQNTAAKPQPAGKLARAKLLLQRKCACGNTTSSLTGECEACSGKQRWQPKLTIGRSNDPLEQEADRVAEQVLAAPAHAAVRAAPPRIQRYSAQAAGVMDNAPASVDRVLASAGRPLDTALQQDMGQRFGYDFSRVRVHVGATAEQSAREVNAHAYTVGHNLVFGAGQFAPGSRVGRHLLAHELTHVVQQSGVAGLNAGQSNLLQRAMKFELQTENVVWKIGGKAKEKLPRKFGPEGNKFLHKGLKGKPAKGDKEGTAVELQSEARGFVEFETPSWHRDWCEVKERIQEAVDMVDAINKSKVVSTIGGIKTVEFPFDVKHLNKTKYFSKGLKAGESLLVEILDSTWSAKIQASESFELSQFESYMTEHMTSGRVTSIIGSAKKILQDANTKKIPDKDIVSLLNFLQIIFEHITEAQLWNKDKTHLAKENISLMSRTNFASMYQQLLSTDEQDMFKAIVKGDTILKEVGAIRKTLVFPAGFVGKKSPGPTIYDWLVSVHKQDRDLLSSLGGDNRAMGRFLVEKEKGKKDTNLVKFEARATSGHTQVLPAVGWVKFAEEVFKAAHTNRSRTGSTELIYDPKKCP